MLRPVDAARVCSYLGWLRDWFARDLFASQPRLEASRIDAVAHTAEPLIARHWRPPYRAFLTMN